MARSEHDREDLMREATALSPRIELHSNAILDGPVVVGFRRDGSASVYFGADPVYHFNAGGEWRRGFRLGRLLKADRGQVVELERQRGDVEVLLLSRQLSSDETSQYFTQMVSQLTQLRDAIDSGNIRITGQVPLEVDVLTRVRTWLQERLPKIVIADRPHVL